MSFWSKVEAFFEKLGGASFEQKVQTVSTVCAALLETAVGLVAGEPAAALVTSIVKDVQSDFAAVAAVAASATAGGTTKPTVTSILSGTQTNLGALVTSAGVKNSAKVSEVTSIINTVISEIDAIKSAV